MGLTRLAIQRPIVLLMAIAALMVLGWRARMNMPAELDPRVEIPVINVMTVYAGAGPTEVEQRVSRPIEDAVASVSNVTSVDSRSLENVSFVTVKLRLGSDANAAAADVRARIESVRRQLPEDIEPPQVSRFDYNARPIMVLGITSKGSQQRLRTVVEEEIKPRLSQVPGVGTVTVVGGLQREVQIRVDPDRLAGYGLSLLDILRPLRAASQSVPAGPITQGGREVTVRVIGEFRSLQDVRNTPIPTQASTGMLMPDPRMAGGQTPRGQTQSPANVVRLGDVATVADTTAPREQITRVGRRESIGLIVSRLSDANTVQVAEGVHKTLESLKTFVPHDIRVSILQDNSQTVADALEDINVTLILGAVLAVLVVLLFLHSVKDTLIVACAIPISIIATFLVMYFAGFSLNQMTMLALSLSVGILVDDSILVLECIHRHRALGKPPHEAALDGRAEIGLADAANTFADIVVFLPIAFMGGIVGQFFREFGLTIATATLASLYVSFTLTPMLAARWFRPGEGIDDPDAPPRRGFPGWFDRRYERLELAYRHGLEWALRHRAVVVATGFGSLALVGFLAWQVLGFDFTPSVDRGQVSVQVELPPGASLRATDQIVARVEAEAVKIPEVDPERMLASVGEVIGGFGALPDRGPQFGQVTLMLIEKQGFLDKLLRPFGQPGRRNRSDEDVAADLRWRLRRVPGSDSVTVSAVRGLTSALAPLQLDLRGNDLRELERVSEEIRRRMARLPELQNVDTSLRRGRPELQVVLNRDRAEDLMVTSAELSSALRTAIAGNTDLRYRERDQTFPIRLLVSRQGPNSPQAGPDALRNLVVTHRGPTPVYVGDIADIRIGAGPTKILRSQRTRRVVISANLKDGVPLQAARQAVDAALIDMNTGSVMKQWGGEVDDMEESAGLMAGALILAIALSYMLMAALFNSLLHPFTILLSVPMALVGGLLGLIYTGTTMNIVSMIGIVMLTGLVSKNAILLIDYTNTLRRRGLSRDAAIQAAGPVRLRPILMTTIAMVIGMLPVALQIGRASEMRSPMAIVVIGGLILSTLLTLLVIPVMYSYMDDVSGGIQQAWRRAVHPKEFAASENGHREERIAVRQETADPD
jgi:hydrophobic/amphiphilic exporter-1 (mainly G- bacteria), HAE1 family